MKLPLETIHYSDLEEMPLKSLYEAERVSNQLFINEHVFRDHLIQVRTSSFRTWAICFNSCFSNFQICQSCRSIAIFLMTIVSAFCQILQSCLLTAPKSRANRIKIIIYSRMSIGIAGGGISGLSFALKASRISSKPIRIYEKDAQLGGWIQTIRTDSGKGSTWSTLSPWYYEKMTRKMSSRT